MAPTTFESEDFPYPIFASAVLWWILLIFPVSYDNYSSGTACLRNTV